MSPTPAKASDAEIIAAARTILERGGIDAVTMASVADAVGIRPPSLYKHVADRAGLVAAMAADASVELGHILAAADPGDDTLPADRVAALVDAFRGFVRRSPRAVALLFADLGPGTRAPIEASVAAAAPILTVAAALAGADEALPAARVLTAFAYGFTSMEAAGAFRLGGDVDAAYRLGISALIDGLAEAR